MRKVLFLFIVIPLLFVVSLAAQSPNATINGLVLDPAGALIVGADVLVVNDATGVQYATKTNGEGIYLVANLPPGTYRIQVSSTGFKTIIKPDIVIHVQDALAINFTLPIGAVSEIVTVSGGAPLINTENAAVSTVVDRTYVGNMPLNGRSFQDLILLTPGVVTNSPQDQLPPGIGVSGEFSVNGQRTESNYYTVDGVSGNVGAVAAGGVYAGAVSGSLPMSTALGTTQGLVSVDDLEEFRVQSATYSAEYGRNPGGQFSFVTRSGTNQWHGTAFEYLRNDLFDANNWFNNYFGRPKPALRQNDFGGTFGGRIEVPGLYDGKDKSFFFFSYEGLRLVQPQAASINFVPSVALRDSAPSVLQPVLAAFPLPNCPSAASNCSNDLGNGLGQFIAAWSNPSRIDAVSIRADHNVSEKLKMFFRFSDTPSGADIRGTGNNSSPAVVTANSFETRSYTLGANSVFALPLSNEARLNYSSSDASLSTPEVGGYGGGKPIDLLALSGSTVPNAEALFGLFIAGNSPSLFQLSPSGVQTQWNLVDTLSISLGAHQLKFGADYRRLNFQGASRPQANYFYFSEASVQANAAFAVAVNQAARYPVYQNFSAFAQDVWRVTSRLNLSTGLRWEVNPAPGVSQGLMPYTVEGSSLSALKLAPQGTPLWQTTWFNFAPRLGANYVLRRMPGWETVVRGGGGLFFDSGQQNGSAGFNGPGFSARAFFPSIAFPLSPAQATPPITNPPSPPYTTFFVSAPHLQLPYTLEWNASVEQALGTWQALTLSYVGAHAGRLLEGKQITVTPFNPDFGTGLFYQNGGTADYHALQLQFQRRINRGLQSLASYTWSHSFDYGSSSALFPYVRGNSDFDVRHNFSAALSYDIPGAFKNRFASAILHRWGLDTRFTARTAFPVTLNGPQFLDPATGQTSFAGLDVVPGSPLYLYGSLYPGGKAINPGAFVPPPGCSISSCPAPTMGDAARNFVRGYGAWQMDFAVRREFPTHERLKLQFRAEAFNIFNHPNFGRINANYCAPGPGCNFGQVTATLAQSLGVLSPLYQMGGPRSLQFALKLVY